MSKRVSNKRGEHAGSRCGRIRLGYYRKRKLDRLQEQREKAHEDMKKAKTKDERSEIREAITYMKKQIRSLVPKALLRRHQGK